MFNLQGSEIIFILLIALVVLGPEKLPGAIRRATQTYTELRKMGQGFQSGFKSALDEPLREMRQTADMIRESADPKKIAADAQREASSTLDAERDAEHELDEAADESIGEYVEKPVSGSMALHSTPGSTNGVEPGDLSGSSLGHDDADASVDEWADPVDGAADTPAPVEEHPPSLQRALRADPSLAEDDADTPDRSVNGSRPRPHSPDRAPTHPDSATEAMLDQSIADDVDPDRHDASST